MSRYSDLEVLFIGVVESSSKNRKAWRIDIGVKRQWPMSWLDCPPWRKANPKHFPVRTFMGTGGLAWSEIIDGKYLGVGELRNQLNGLIAMEVLSKANSSSEINSTFLNNLVNKEN